MKKIMSIILALVMASSIIAGCAPTAAPTPPETPATATTPTAPGTPEQPTGAQVRSDRTLTVAINAEPSSLSPFGGNDIGTGYMTDLVFDTLLTFDCAAGVLRPSLATSWDIIDDTTIRFHLRNDVYFSNGNKMTAEDVRFSLGHAETSVFAVGMLDAIDAANSVAEDDYTFLLRLHYPFAPILNGLAHPLSSIVCSTDFNPDQPIGTGPFVLVERALGDFVRYRVNEYFWGPFVSYTYLFHRFIPEASTRAIELETGGVDIALALHLNDAIRLMERNAHEITIEQLEILNTSWMSFNHGIEPFNDIRVRQAITHAIDIDTVIQAAFRGRAVRAYSAMSPMVIGHYNPGVIYPYNPERAKQLLAEAGFPNGFATALYTNGSQPISEIIQAYLAAVGIDMEIRALDRGVWLDAIVNGRQQMFLGGWTAITGDADYAIGAILHSRNHGGGGNRSFFTNAELDALFDAAAAEMDHEVRMEMYREAQILIAHEAPMVNFNVGFVFVGYRNNIQNLVSRASQRYDYWLVTFAD